MKTIDVLYFVEHVSRELDTACIVKYLCETKYGLSVKIASLPLEVKSVIHLYQPHIVALPYLYSAQSAKIPPIIKHWKDLTYLNLNYEQFFSKINKKFRAPGDSFVRNEVYHHVWGESFKEFLVKNGVKENNIFVNGNPSYMLYQKPYCDYFPARSDLAKKYELNERKRWLFFPENFAWAFLSNARIKSYIRTGYDSEIAYENREFNRKSLREVIHWFNHIALDPNIEIIVRPRPAVHRDAYVRKFEKELPNIPPAIHIIKEGDIREWNLASDIVVSSFSTSLLEAAVADKPIYMLEPYAFPDWLQAGWYDLVPHIRSRDELENICHQEPDPLSWQPAQDYVMRTALSKGDAIANIARILYDLRQVRNTPAKYVRSKLIPQVLVPGITTRSITKTLRALRSASHRSMANRSEHKANTRDDALDNDFTDEDVNVRIKRWELILQNHLPE